MAVTETPVMYQSSDGQEFDNQAVAEKHEQFLTARKEYERAQAVYGKLIAESQTTMDGEPFKYNMWHDYWRIVRIWGHIPQIEKIDFHMPNYSVDGFDRVSIHNGYASGGRGPYLVGELYFHKKNAQAALLVAIDEYIADVQAQADKLRNPS